MGRIRKQDKHKVDIYLTTEHFTLVEKDFLEFNRRHNLDLTISEYFVKILKDHLVRASKTRKKNTNYKFLEP